MSTESVRKASVWTVNRSAAQMLGRVVAQKRAPRLTRRSPQRLPAVTTHGASADLEAKGTQLTNDADGRGTA